MRRATHALRCDGGAYGSLWGLHMFQWLVALTALRVLMTWAYHHTGSLLPGVLLHASFTGGQFLLWPPAATPRAVRKPNTRAARKSRTCEIWSRECRE